MISSVKHPESKRERKRDVGWEGGRRGHETGSLRSMEKLRLVVGNRGVESFR